MHGDPIRQESEAPDLHEPTWQDMQQIAANELDSIEGHQLLLVSVSGVSPAERYATVGELNNATVGDGDSVRIPRKVLDDVLGPIQRWLRVDDPLDLL